ncbi:MAG: extracellular solute-binding protein [Planctomycetes bacterium]|nr:extracellular solute-binding protein [Planctomycetota bacterium]
MKTPHLIAAALVALALVAAVFDRAPNVEQTVRAGYQFHPASAEDLRDADAVHLTYWEKWNNFEGEAMQACVDGFNAHSQKALKSSDTEERRRFLSPGGRRIFVHLLSTTQVNQKAKMAVSGGVPPDIAGLWSRDVPVFANFNAATPLDEWIKRDGPSPDEYQKCYWDMCVYEGRVWALPTTPSTIAMYWNKDLFKNAGLDPERPPKTLAELDAYNEKLTQRDANGRIAQMGFHPAEMRTFKGGLGTFDSPQNAFIAGKVGMVLQGVWMANYIRMHNPSMRWGVAPFPGPGGDEANPVTLAQADVLLIPRGCPHPEEAWRFVRYVNSRGDPKDPNAPLDGMEILCLKQGKHTPFKTTTKTFLDQHSHEALKVFIDLGNTKNVYIEPMMPMWEEIRAAIPASFEELMSQGDQPGHSPGDILKRLQNRLQPKLDAEWVRIDRAKSAEGLKP